jgi:hypothetical protein
MKYKLQCGTVAIMRGHCLNAAFFRDIFSTLIFNYPVSIQLKASCRFISFLSVYHCLMAYMRMCAHHAVQGLGVKHLDRGGMAYLQVKLTFILFKLSLSLNAGDKM